MKAFVAGDKSGITDDISNIFKSSGLAHVLAVSGLHVSVFISLFVGLLKLFNISKRKEMLSGQKLQKGRHTQALLNLSHLSVRLLTSAVLMV